MGGRVSAGRQFVVAAGAAHSIRTLRGTICPHELSDGGNFRQSPRVLREACSRRHHGRLHRRVEVLYPDGLLRGSEAIRRFFAVMFEEFEKPGMSFELLRQDVFGDTAYIVWTAETADNRFEVGTDTFIVQNGKILTQTFGGKISPKH
jgi:hypothetical protein